MLSSIDPQSIVIRDIETAAEMRATEDLQIEAWGEDERDIVPLNQLAAARYVGGSLIGAFNGERLVGFVYGFYGHLQGRVVHHSHMLAVHPSYRNHNLAFRLKLAQRTKVLTDNLTDLITWTFDPLQSLNAHFNFTKLGVISDLYKVNVYGEAAGSFLHRNGTDRFFVTWPIVSRRVEDRIAGTAGPILNSNSYQQSSLCLLACSDSGAPERLSIPKDLSAVDSILIEIPANINAIESSNFEVARMWREESRQILLEAMARGFVVTEYFLKSEQTGNYVLENRRREEIRIL